MIYLLFLAGLIEASTAVTQPATCLQQYCQYSCLVKLNIDYTCLTQGQLNTLLDCNTLQSDYNVNEMTNAVNADSSVASASCSDTLKSCPGGLKSHGDTTCRPSCSLADGYEYNINGDMTCGPPCSFADGFVGCTDDEWQKIKVFYSNRQSCTT